MSKFMQLTEFVHFVESELMLNPGEVDATSEFRSLRTWSSLNALILISRINEETDFVITAGDLATCTTIKDLHQLLK